MLFAPTLPGRRPSNRDRQEFSDSLLRGLLGSPYPVSCIAHPHKGASVIAPRSAAPSAWPPQQQPLAQSALPPACLAAAIRYRYAIIRRPATGAITPLLARSRLGSSIARPQSYLLLLSIALCQRLFRPRAKAAYSSRSRCWRSCSRVCLGETRYDKNRIRSDPPLAEMHRPVPYQLYPNIWSNKLFTYNILCFVANCK